MPYLNFSTEYFTCLPKFSKFVTHFLCRRNSRIDDSSLKLSFRGKVNQPCVKNLMDYAFSHNIQQLEVACSPENDNEFPLSLFRPAGRSLKHLSLKVFKARCRSRNRSKWVRLKATSTLELPALTTLYLEDVCFCSDDHPDNWAGLLSKRPNLKNLTMKTCGTEGMSSFSICHPGMSNLTLDVVNVEVVNVVAPLLQNLSIRSYDTNRPEYVISAPNLASLAYRAGCYPLRLSTKDDAFHFLKEADILVMYPNVADANQMVSLLQQLHNVEFLTLNLEIIELLSSSRELVAHEPSPFVNLKSLTIYPKKLFEREMRGFPKGKVRLSTQVKNYLLYIPRVATFTMCSREDFIALRDVASAKILLTELQGILEQEKANTETKGNVPMERNNAKIHDKGKSQQEMKMQLQIGGNKELIKSCWNDLGVKFEQRKAKAYLIISKLKSIEGLLKKLPATNRAMIQPCFSSLCAKADIVMSKLMKMQCEENQSRISVCFDELATSTTMEPSS